MKESNSFWRGMTLGGQSYLQYLLPGQLSDRMSVTLFLKGNLMNEAEGCPERTGRILFGKRHENMLVAPLQRHNTAMIDARSIWALPARPEADAVFLQERGVYGSLRFADCIPLVIASHAPYDWCVLIHSGFMGTCRRIVANVLERISRRTGGDGIEHSHAWIGPGIGMCCYSRSADDPLALLGVRELPSDCIGREGNLIYFNLSKAIITLLYDKGISLSNIHQSGICTSCNPTLCYSYRNGDSTERSFLIARIYPRCHNRYHWWENNVEEDFI